MSKRRKLTWARKRVSDGSGKLDKLRRRPTRKAERFERRHGVIED